VVLGRGREPDDELQQQRSHEDLGPM
jgi:hypothetical protein